MVIAVFNLVQVPFNANPVNALHLAIVHFSRGDTSHRAYVARAYERPP
jgi:hypothetical protein